MVMMAVMMTVLMIGFVRAHGRTLARACDQLPLQQLRVATVAVGAQHPAQSLR